MQSPKTGVKIHKRADDQKLDFKHKILPEYLVFMIQGHRGVSVEHLVKPVPGVKSKQQSNASK